jgi:uncharacterized protein involved in response to NO
VCPRRRIDRQAQRYISAVVPGRHLAADRAAMREGPSGAFVPIGFLLNACGAFGIVPVGAGIHAWMAGAAGIMTLAVMSRATLGHTGQQLTASVATQAVYASIIVAVVARICAVLEPVHGVPLLHIAAFAWAGAFLGFALCYGPTLIGFDKRSLQQPVTAWREAD